MPTREEISAFLERDFPQNTCTVEEVGSGKSVVRQVIGEAALHPGGSVSGAVMMALADTALYVALLGEIGIIPLAVTTNLTTNFLQKPAANKDMIGVCALIKVGKSLAVGEVNLYSEGETAPVAHAVGTYGIPPKHS